MNRLESLSRAHALLEEASVLLARENRHTPAGSVPSFLYEKAWSATLAVRRVIEALEEQVEAMAHVDTDAAILTVRPAHEVGRVRSNISERDRNERRSSR